MRVYLVFLTLLNASNALQTIKVSCPFLTPFNRTKVLFTWVWLIAYNFLHISSSTSFAQGLQGDSHIRLIAQKDSILELGKHAASDATDTSAVNLIYQFELHDMIAPPAARLVENAIKAAEDRSATHLLMDLDTYGGYVDAADEIRTSLLKTNLITLVFIRNNAASAGALISIACDSIYMATGSTIGAATVVDMEGKEAPDKYQSYMRTKMRATAEATGRDPDIAEGMVDDRVEIEGITEEGKIITFTADDAIKYGYCNAKLESTAAVIRHINLDNYQLVEHQLSALDEVIDFLINPAVSGVLLLIIVAGIYFELQSPGVGFPSAAAIIAAVLYFAPLYLEGLAEHWEILLFVVGLILIVVEIFVIPGFGVTGFSGIILVIGGLTLALIQNVVFDFGWVPTREISTSLLLVMGSMAVSVVLLFIFGKSFFDSAAFRTIALEASEATSEGYVIDVKENTEIVGKTGIAVTDLRPSGKIEVDGNRYDAQADAEYILKGTRVRVEKAHGAYLIVFSLPESNAT